MSVQDQDQGIVQDKLKDQITISIKDSLDKATTVLSSLHRVHSYLDVLKTMPSFRTGTGSEGLKGALEQVRSIRTDAAALLQTIYLTEIGLQSLQDVDKHTPSVCTTTSEVTILPVTVPILGESMNSSTLSQSAINSNGEEVVKGRAVVEVTRQQDGNETEVAEDMLPPAKKINMGVVITNCTTCNRKFASNQVDPHQGGKCKNCRSTGTPSASIGQVNVPTSVIKTLLTPTTTSQPMLSSTPHKSTSGSKSKIRKISNPPISCKVCGISFVYRRCLFRHLRENHPGIDLNKIYDYIETEKTVENPVEDESALVPGSQNTSMNVTVGSEVIPSEVDESGIADPPPLGRVLEESPVVSGHDASQNDRIGLGDPEKRVYTCTICNKVFDRPYRLTRHIQIHDPNRPRVSCQICDRSFTRYDTLENHVKTMHSDERPYNCQYPSCSKTFATQSALINHLKVHTDGKPYKCLECDSSFTLLLEYKLHVRSVHPHTENRCNDCYKVFPSPEELETHRSVEHRLECEICGKSFARLAYLQLHVQVHSGEHTYNCKFCSQGFDSEYAYKQHMKTHPEKQRSNKRGFHCQLCEIGFEEPSNLIAHYRTQEHRDKANSLGIGADTTILNTIEGDLSDMNDLVNEVAMATDTMATKPIAMEDNSVDHELGITADKEPKMMSIAKEGSFEA